MLDLLLSGALSYSFMEQKEIGIASYYGPGFHGKRTGSGSIFDMNKLTAAHKTLKFGTKIKVTRLSNNRSVVVTINDSGPFVKNRCLDLSYGAAKKLDMIKSGIAPIMFRIIENGKRNRINPRKSSFSRLLKINRN
jgi:rare lipoprotein A